MSTNYKKITDLTMLTGEILNNDMILMARKDTTDIGYSTYKTYFLTLSTNLINNVKHAVLSVALLTSINQLRPTATLSAIAGNVGYDLSSSINNVNSKTVKNLSDINNISTSFDNLVSELPETIIRYSPTKRISNTSPTVWNYKVIKTTAKIHVDMTNYNNLGVTLFGSNSISVALSAVEKGPLVHIVSLDSIVVITLTLCNKNLYVFVNSGISTPTSETKSLIKTNLDDVYGSGWICIGHFLDANDVLHIPCAKNTCICLYNGITNSLAEYKPKYTSTITNNANILIKEFY